MEFARFPQPTPMVAERPASAEPVATPAKEPSPTVDEARAAADAAESAWRQTVQIARLSADPNTAAAALMLASQAASKSAQAQTVYAEARARVTSTKPI